MTRILHLVATLDRGGTEVSCLALAAEFARRGADNHVVALQRGAGGIVEALATVTGEEPTVLPDGRLARATAFHTLARRLRPDAVIFHVFNIEHVTLGLAARAAGVGRLAAKLGNPVSTDPSVRDKTRTILRLTRLLGVPIVSASRWIEESLREIARLPATATVVHNGCDVGGIARRAAAARARRPHGEAVIGMVARLDPIKDHATLLAAFARLPQALDDRPTRLVLVGDGGLRAALEAEASRLGIAERVTFAGARADVPACREVLEGGALGRLVPPGDAAALAATLREAIGAPAAAPQLEDVNRRYSVAAMADDHVRLLFGRHSTIGPAAGPQGAP